MAPVTDYSTTPADNTSISGLAVSDATVVATVDDIIRQMMADIRSADDQNLKLTGNQTATGTKTFGSVAAGSLRATASSAAILTLQDTTEATTHNQTRLIRDGASFKQQTSTSAGVAVTDDYVATTGASGVTAHEWRIAGVPRFSIGASSYNFADAAQARAGMSAMPAIIAGSGAGQIIALDAANGASLSLPGSGGQTYAYWYVPQTVSGGALGTSQVGVAAGATLLNSGTAGIILRGFCIRLT